MLEEKYGSTEQGASSSDSGKWKSGECKDFTEPTVERHTNRKGKECIINGENSMNKSREPCES